jgi:GT2 family glycosyltransferase/2-polyprenyl-3-methyl-5-hydroxy-6-metoxy-1,4-benzoquinol methylase
MPEFRPKDICVVIPTRQRWDMLARTLKAFRRQTVQGFEIIVLADATEEPSTPLDGARLILKPDTGVSERRNLGARTTDRKLLLLLGDDTIPTEDLIEQHLVRHNRDPDRTVAILGKIEWHPEVAGHPVLQWLDRSGMQFDYPASSNEEAGWARFYASNLSIKRDLFLEVGGFDEDFTFTYEDLDVGLRLGEAGMKLFYEPAARVLHHHVYDIEGLRRRFAATAEGEWLMIKKHPDFPAFFAPRIQAADEARPVSRLWPLVVDRIPLGNAIRRRAEARTHVWFLQQIADPFLSHWEAQREREDLMEYLGREYDENLLRGHEAAIEEEFDSAVDEETFYRTSRMYLYDLTVFAMSGTKRPYRQVLKKLVRPGARLLDWGCGIGSDGLRLIEDGYRVSFADFDNPSTAYLRWRLKQRGLEADVFDIASDTIPSGFDAAYSFDVIEHVDDPIGFLDQLDSLASVVIVNLLEPDPNDIHLHKPLPIKQLIDRAEKKGLIFYRKFHRRSHLIAYRTGTASVAGRAIGRARRLLADPFPG